MSELITNVALQLLSMRSSNFCAIPHEWQMLIFYLAERAEDDETEGEGTMASDQRWHGGTRG